MCILPREGAVVVVEKIKWAGGSNGKTKAHRGAEASHVVGCAERVESLNLESVHELARLGKDAGVDLGPLVVLGGEAHVVEDDACGEASHCREM